MSASKKQFIEKLLRERDKFELTLNRVGFTRRMTLKGVTGKWSIKDILAHILAYEQYIADRLNEILHGQEYTPCKTQSALDAFLDEHGYPDFGSPLLDDESPNAWVVEKYKNVSLEDVVAQEVQAFSTIVSMLEKLPQKLIDEHNLFDRVANNTYKHYREHLRDIRHWLKTHAVNS
ncbi:MAG: ClbS/DfsB family four-helix bundle protein [Anaerolineales bacterium]|nr:MAG: ClbS/DfsB family four-helix bundle protein [Anaerolineales bacterium]